MTESEARMETRPECPPQPPPQPGPGGVALGAWLAWALIGCPEVSPENKALEQSVLPAFYSPRTQTQSTLRSL